jgi:predicted TIM-barrel fold metal-dependent hydrolase
LRDLDRQGFVGIRLNLVGKPNPTFDQNEWSDHLARIVDLNWQIEIQAESKRWPDLLPPLLAKGAKVVADHFGLPDKTSGVDDPGFRALLSTGKTGQVWVKLSGAYRNGPNGEQIVKAAYPLLREAFGTDHLVWGSDWPHTQFETVMTPSKARQALDSWVIDEKERQTILTDAPAHLFRFPV